MSDHPTSRQQKKRQKKKRGLLFKIFLLCSLLMIATVTIGGFQIYGLVQDAPEISEETFHFSNSSTLFDSNDEEITDLNGGEHRKSIAIEEVPLFVQQAFIAVEDIRFETHSGIDIKRIGGAVISNITDGFGSEGGSTITQQVVKNSLLTAEKSIDRKVQEAYLALKLEEQYTKDEILEMYLNKIYFGNGAYGIVTAADTYFDKTIEQLTIEEAALLAGLPQRPTGYNPYQHPELAENRRNIVLSLMMEHDFISEQEYSDAVEVPLEEMLREGESTHTVSHAFMDQVFKELESIEGLSTSEIYNGGLKIYTTLDPHAQQHVEKVLNTSDYVTYPDDRFQAGITLIDTNTGEIKAIGGGRNQEAGKNRTNYATNIQRSPGSTIKPILSYGPAIEYLKWSTYQQIEDEEITYTGTDQVIRNYNNQYHGILSIREALKQSWNVPAVKTFNEVGSKRAEQFAANVGISFEEPVYESYALGSFNQGISPLELAGAYAAFGNEGIYHKPHAVRKVVFPDGTEINKQPESVQAMSDYTAYMVTDMLQTVVNEGTGRQAGIQNIAIAGKTGTTNFEEEIKEKYKISEGVPDVWFAGYTTNYTAAVWTGYPQLSEENYIKTREDRQIAQHIFREVMAEVSKDSEIDNFIKPASVEEITINTKTGERAMSGVGSSDTVTELFVTGTSVENAYSLVKDQWKEKKRRSNHNGNNSKRKEEESSSVTEEEKSSEEDKDENVDQSKDKEEGKTPKEETDRLDNKKEKEDKKDKKEPMQEKKPNKEKENKNESPPESTNDQNANKEESKNEEEEKLEEQDKQDEAQQDSSASGQQSGDEGENNNVEEEEESE